MLDTVSNIGAYPLLLAIIACMEGNMDKIEYLELLIYAIRNITRNLSNLEFFYYTL